MQIFISDPTNIERNGYSVAGENVRASREKSGNQRLANLPTCYYKYVYVILCIQSCPILRGINTHLLQFLIFRVAHAPVVTTAFPETKTTVTES
jgi:hypothetical protein